MPPSVTYPLSLKLSSNLLYGSLSLLRYSTTEGWPFVFGLWEDFVLEKSSELRGEVIAVSGLMLRKLLEKLFGSLECSGLHSLYGKEEDGDDI